MRKHNQKKSPNDGQDRPDREILNFPVKNEKPKEVQMYEKNQTYNCITA